MARITEKFIEKLNEETTAENWESIVDKYELETPSDYDHDDIREQDGMEVWGVTPGGSEVLVYDNNSGWYLLPLKKWMDEIIGHLEELGYNDLEITATLLGIPALRVFFQSKKSTTIKVSGEFKDQLDTQKIYDDETYENAMKRIIKERDEFKAKVEEQEKNQ